MVCLYRHGKGAEMHGMELLWACALILAGPVAALGLAALSGWAGANPHEEDDTP